MIGIKSKEPKNEVMKYLKTLMIRDSRHAILLRPSTKNRHIDFNFKRNIFEHQIICPTGEHDENCNPILTWHDSRLTGKNVHHTGVWPANGWSIYKLGKSLFWHWVFFSAHFNFSIYCWFSIQKLFYSTHSYGFYVVKKIKSTSNNFLKISNSF